MIIFFTPEYPLEKRKYKHLVANLKSDLTKTAKSPLKF